MAPPNPGTAEACCARSKYTRCPIAFRITMACVGLIVGVVMITLNMKKYNNMASGAWACVSTFLSVVSLTLHISVWAGGCSRPRSYIPLRCTFLLGVLAALAGLAGTIASIVRGVQLGQKFERKGYHDPGEPENNWIIMFMCLLVLRAGLFMLRFSFVYIRELRDSHVPTPRYANQPSVIPIVGRSDSQFSTTSETAPGTLPQSSSSYYYGGTQGYNGYAGSVNSIDAQYSPPVGVDVPPHEHFVDKGAREKKW